MARKKLFGNTKDPRCETCLHGKRSSDGDSILCKRGGVLPPSHQCRHFQYDPLRRTPNRVRPLEEFDAAEFALDEVSAEWLEAVAHEEPSPDDVRHRDLMKKLRSYLNETASPNVDDILVLLNETPVDPSDTASLLAEADALLGNAGEEPPAATPAPSTVSEPVAHIDVQAAVEHPAPEPPVAEAADKTPGVEAETVEEPVVETVAVETPTTQDVTPEKNSDLSIVDTIVDTIADDTAVVENATIDQDPVTQPTMDDEIGGAIPTEDVSEAPDASEIKTSAIETDPEIHDVFETVQGSRAFLEEAQAFLKNDIAAAERPAEEPDEASIEQSFEEPVKDSVEEPSAQPAPLFANTPDGSPSVWHADSSLDITGDLERLTVNVVQSSTPAAFRNFDLKLDDGDEPQEERDDIKFDTAVFSEDALLTAPTGSDLDDESLRAEDLIFLSETSLADDDNDMIEMNADGTFTQFKER